jgi:hypothetical protein
VGPDRMSGRLGVVCDENRRVEMSGRHGSFIRTAGVNGSLGRKRAALDEIDFAEALTTAAAPP